MALEIYLFLLYYYSLLAVRALTAHHENVLLAIVAKCLRPWTYNVVVEWFFFRKKNSSIIYICTHPVTFDVALYRYMCSCRLLNAFPPNTNRI